MKGRKRDKDREMQQYLCDRYQKQQSRAHFKTCTSLNVENYCSTKFPKKLV
jgi:hypothetical protein